MGVDLVENPDAALNFEYAVPIMIWGAQNGIFTGRKLSNYNNGKVYDYYSARAIINGDKAKIHSGETISVGRKIESYALRYEKILIQTSKLPKEF